MSYIVEETLHSYYNNTIGTYILIYKNYILCEDNIILYYYKYSGMVILSKL